MQTTAKQLTLTILTNLINAKADRYGKLIDNPYGAQALLEDTIGCLKECETADNGFEAVDAHVKKVDVLHKAIDKAPYPPAVKTHLIEMMAVCHPAIDNRGFFTSPAVELKELIETLQAKV